MVYLNTLPCHVKTISHITNLVCKSQPKYLMWMAQKSKMLVRAACQVKLNCETKVILTMVSRMIFSYPAEASGASLWPGLSLSIIVLATSEPLCVSPICFSILYLCDFAQNPK